jgi:hypothetical protein
MTKRRAVATKVKREMRQRQTSTLITALIVLVGVALASMILAGMVGDSSRAA